MKKSKKLSLVLLAVFVYIAIPVIMITFYDPTPWSGPIKENIRFILIWPVMLLWLLHPVS